MSRPARIAVALLYAAMLAGVVWGMFYARDTAAPRLAGREGQAAWDAWRDEAAAQSQGKGPVARRPQPSAQPPLVVLMRDYFAVCMAGALIFSSLLFAVLAFVIQGAIAGSPAARQNAQDAQA